MRGNKPTLAIFDPHYPTCLAIARTLGKKGIPFCVYGHQSLPMSRLSRYVKHYGFCPDLYHYGEFSTWLKHKLKHREIQLIAPTSDMIAFYIAEFFSYFPTDIQDRMPNSERVMNCIFKDRFHQVCIENKIPTTKVHFPKSRDEAVSLSKTLTYPVILKPKSHVVAGLGRGATAHSPDELKHYFVPYEIPNAIKPLAQRFPSHQWPMIQQKINASMQDFVSISGVLGSDKTPLAYSAAVKTGQWPPNLGVGVSFHSYNDKNVLEQGVNMARALIGKGLFEIELVPDGSGGCVIPLDLNPRAYGQIALDIARGNDLPYLWYRIMQGETVDPVLTPDTDYTWVHGTWKPVEWLNQLKLSNSKRNELLKTLKSKNSLRVNGVFDATDPLPLLRDTASNIRHIRSLLRPLWQRPPSL